MHCTSRNATATFCVAAAVAWAAGAPGAMAANIYVLSSGDIATDSAVATVLTSFGHSVTIGVEYTAFNGSQNLSGFDTVYLQANANWTAPGNMPLAGQQAIINWVNAGGRLVTSEWVIYFAYPFSKFELFEAFLPIENSFIYGSTTAATFTMQTPDPLITEGLPAMFNVPLTDYAGTETFSIAKAGASVYYTTSNSPGAPALAGWARGSGLVFSFTSTCGPVQVSDTNFGRLFSNVMGPVTGGCYANCDASSIEPILNIDDFTCFINEFAASLALPPSQQVTSYANCDGSTVPPALNIDDFTCFINAFAAGCP